MYVYVAARVVPPWKERLTCASVWLPDPIIRIRLVRVIELRSDSNGRFSSSMSLALEHRYSNGARRAQYSN